MDFTPEIAADEERQLHISAHYPMAFTPEIAVDPASRDLYDALLHGEKERVLQLCGKLRGGPLRVVTIHNDTVLHVATSCKQADLVHKLLEMVSNDESDKLTFQNKVKNTILHEASTADKLVEVAKEMLIKAPELLNMRNIFEVTPLYRSVVFGRIEMFKLLDEEFIRQKQRIGQEDLEVDCEGYYYKDNTTILHTAVVIGNFELALLIAKRHKHLVDKKDLQEWDDCSSASCMQFIGFRKERWWGIP